MQNSDTILSLQQELLAEASSAPKLFRDLGKVEQYIAESYKTRSFIELIQNADDANSSAFGIYSMDNMLVVANNGRPFTVHDIEALCRYSRLSTIDMAIDLLEDFLAFLYGNGGKKKYFNNNYLTCPTCCVELVGNDEGELYCPECGERQ